MFNGFKLQTDGQQAVYRFIAAEPNHIGVVAVVSQCHKYSSNNFLLTFAPLNLLVPEALKSQST